MLPANLDRQQKTHYAPQVKNKNAIPLYSAELLNHAQAARHIDIVETQNISFSQERYLSMPTFLSAIIRA
jgi:hypothetical protein